MQKGEILPLVSKPLFQSILPKILDEKKKSSTIS